VRVAAPVEKVWEFHSSAASLEKLAMPSQKVHISGGNRRVEEGAEHVLRFRQFGFSMTWVARISQVTPPFGFTDQAKKSPFSFWRHRHDFIPDGDGTLIRDIVVYEMPFGKLGRAIHKYVVEKKIQEMFDYRHQATKVALEA